MEDYARYAKNDEVHSLETDPLFISPSSLKLLIFGKRFQGIIMQRLFLMETLYKKEVLERNYTILDANLLKRKMDDFWFRQNRKVSNSRVICDFYIEE